MNIFYLDNDTKKCAEYHHDVHLRKMIVEYAQLLSTAHHLCLPNVSNINHIYKPTHANHPCGIWTRKTQGNYWFLFDLFNSLIEEYHFRFNKTHKTSILRLELQNVPFNLIYGCSGFEAPPLCMPDQYKTYDHVQAYRNFYKAEKMFDKNGKPMDKWTNRPRPYWLDVA